MRLLKIGVYYADYLKQFYAEHPELASRTYATQHAALMHDGFGSSDFWTNALASLGYETCDLVANAEPLQKAWSAEFGYAFNEENWLFPVVTAQVEAFRPDVLLVADYTTVTASFLCHLKERCPSIRLVIVWCGAPYGDASIFAEADVVLSCIPEMVVHFRKNGHCSRHVNHAFDPRVLDRIDAVTPPVFDFVFIGSIVKSHLFHIEREALILRLLDETELQIWSNAPSPSMTHQPDDRSNVGRAARFVSLPLVGGMARRAARLLREAGGAQAPSLTSVDERIMRRARPSLFGLKMFQQLRLGRVALNTHIDISPVSASNMRLFEATGVGACLLTDWKANLSDLFEPDSEVIAYRDADECVEKVRYLLGHEVERRSIAAAGQRRTLRDHSFDHRGAQIDAVIREALEDKRLTGQRPG